MTKLKEGNIHLTWGSHSMRLSILLPEFLAKELDGNHTPECWDDPLGKLVLGESEVEVSWSGRFDFTGHGQDQQPKKGSRRGTRAGQLYSGTGMDKGQKRAAVQRKPGEWERGRGVRQLSLPYRSQTVPTVNAGKMALSGYTRCATRKNTKRLVSTKRIKTMASAYAGR